MATTTKRTTKAKNGNGFNYGAASSEALVDFGGAADALVKKNTKIVNDVKVELRERCDNLDRDDTMTVAAEDYVGTVGIVPRKVAIKTLTNAEIIEKLGQEVFNTLATFPVGLMKEYLSKADYDDLVGDPIDGTRAVSLKERTD